MTIFSYTAVDSDGKEVCGSLESADLATATSALKDLRMDILHIDESSRMKREQQYVQKIDAGLGENLSALHLFHFEAKDASNQPHQGTLQAENRGVAFRRLRDQGFEVISLLSSDDASVPAALATSPTPVQSEISSTVQPLRSDSSTVPHSSTAYSSPLPTAPSLARAASLLAPVESLDSLSSATQSLTDTQNPPSASTSISPSIPPSQSIHSSPQESSRPVYASLFLTMRLYAGWLLTWYGLFMTFGYYLTVRNLPFSIPGAEGFYNSDIIFTFILAIFLYLMLHTLFEAVRGGSLVGAAFIITGVFLFLSLRIQLLV